MNRPRNPKKPTAPARAGRRWFRVSLLAIAGIGFLAVLAVSGVVAFQRPGKTVALAVTDERGSDKPLGERPAPVVTLDTAVRAYEEVAAKPEATRTGSTQPPHTTPTTTPPQQLRSAAPGVKRDRFGKIIIVNGKPWTGEVFDHRPIVPVRVQTMKTTAYSPDERSCGKWADGITASGKSVWMNGGRLVAADPKLPYGTILTIPGYNHGRPVQVWDRGGKIKGNRLDVLYPTHEIARRWGVQDKRVVFWQYVKTD